MPSGKHKKHHPPPPRNAEVSKDKKDKAKDKDKDKTKDEEDEEELVELPFVDLDDQALVRRILEDELADVSRLPDMISPSNLKRIPYIDRY